MTTAVQAHDVHKRYGEGTAAVAALDGVDFAVQTGELVAIMGPSGSGKSTLLHVLGGLEPATSGQITVADTRVDGASDAALTRLRRDHVGFVFQFFNLMPGLTAAENVLLPALIGHHHGAAQVDRARKLLEQVSLADRAQHTPAELSGGQQQRVSIARALMAEPEVILADEPTGNLDSRAGSEVLAILQRLVREQGRTIVMVTHDPNAAAVAGRVVFMRDGRIVDELPGGDAHELAAHLAAITTETALAG